MIGGLGQISETEKSMAHDKSTWRRDTSGHYFWYQTIIACGIGVRGECFKKKWTMQKF